MKDDIFDKFKTLLSGSLKPVSETKEKTPDDQSNEDLINSFMDQILEASWVESELKAMCAPSYHLSTKNKSYWLMNTTAKSLFSIKGGVEIIPIENGENSSVCLIGQSTYSIPNELIVCSGWN